MNLIIVCIFSKDEVFPLNRFTGDEICTSDVDDELHCWTFFLCHFHIFTLYRHY
mgnify:CR=1 FL=1